MKHLLSLEKLPRADMDVILQNAGVIKSQRGDSQHKPLAGQIWALIFSKSSTRTRVSFEVGIRELGGESLFLSEARRLVFEKTWAIELSVAPAKPQQNGPFCAPTVGLPSGRH